MVILSENSIEEMTFPNATALVAALIMQQAVEPTPTPSFFTMEEVSNVKDSVASGLFIQRLMGEVGGSNG